MRRFNATREAPIKKRSGMMPGSTPAGGQITPFDWESCSLSDGLPVDSLGRGAAALPGGQPRGSAGRADGGADGEGWASTGALATLRAQLSVGGRMIAPVGARNQRLELTRQTPEGFEVQGVGTVRFVPLV